MNPGWPGFSAFQNAVTPVFSLGSHRKGGDDVPVLESRN